MESFSSTSEQDSKPTSGSKGRSTSTRVQVPEPVSNILVRELWRGTEEEVVNALVSLSNLCYDCNNSKAMQLRNRKAVFQGNGHTSVLEVMRKWKASHKVQSAGCIAIQHMLLENGVPPNTLAIKGAFEVVLNAMKEFNNVKMVQGTGCGALANLVFHKATAERFLQLGGLQILIHAMKTFPSCRGLVFHGCWVLCKLSQCRECNSKLVAAGTLRVLADTMEKHQTEKCIFDKARFAMLNLVKLMPELVA